MTDRELLEAAAKAAGYTVESYYADWIKRTGAGGLTEYWNPLEYDEDAFRLMVDCCMELLILEDATDAHTASEYDLHGASEPHGTDKHAATRRAIVRAAAAMGANDAAL